MAYYFAYGDRMNTERMTEDAPSATLVGPGRLEGFRLVFNVISRSWGGGAANAIPDPRSALWGVLWDVDDDELQRLAPINTASFSDVANHATEVAVAGPSGPVSARTFWIESHEAFVRPNDRYFDMLHATAEVQGLPPEALNELERARMGQQAPAPRI
jgi:hypothetical protein